MDDIIESIYRRFEAKAYQLKKNTSISFTLIFAFF